MLSPYLRFLFSETASDVIIVCVRDHIPAHRIILMAQSSFFKAAFTVKMKVRHSPQIEDGWPVALIVTDIPQENLAGVIHLSESTSVVGSILKFLYTNSYDAPTPYLMHHLEVYVAADKYNISGLKDTAARNALAHLNGAECNYMRMTAPDLGTLTVCGTGFFTVTQYVYTNTTDETDVLRLKLASIGRNLLPPRATAQREAWTALFSEVPAFGLDLLMTPPQPPPGRKLEKDLREVISLCLTCVVASHWWPKMGPPTPTVDFCRFDSGSGAWPDPCSECGEKGPGITYRIFKKIT